MEKKSSVQAEKRREQPDGADAELEAGDVAGHVFADGVVEVEVDGLAGVAMQMLEPAVACLPGGEASAGRNRLQGKSQTRCSSQ